MIAALAATWSLFLGLALIMVAHGLQSTLLGVRAGIEGFNETVTGVIMAGYYVGFLAGSLVTPLLVRRVGHIRVFAAVASLASVAVLAPLPADRAGELDDDAHPHRLLRRRPLHRRRILA